MGRPDSILGQFGETARCCDANYFFFICQHYEQTAGPICMEFSGKVWNDMITFFVNCEKPRVAAIHNTGTGFAPQLVSFLITHQHMPDETNGVINAVSCQLPLRSPVCQFLMKFLGRKCKHSNDTI